MDVSRVVPSPHVWAPQVDVSTTRSSYWLSKTVPGPHTLSAYTERDGGAAAATVAAATVVVAARVAAATVAGATVEAAVEAGGGGGGDSGGGEGAAAVVAARAVAASVVAARAVAATAAEEIRRHTGHVGRWRGRGMVMTRAEKLSK